MKREIDPRYFVEAAAKTLDVLESFGSGADELSITEVARRVGVTYSSAFRLLYTLEKRGYVMRRPGKKRYLLSPVRKRFRIGYAALGSKFGDEVTRSMISAARKFGITLLVKNNAMSPSKALSNADGLLAEKIDLFVEYQLNEATSHLIAAKCHEAAVPAIAINFAQPGAYYFGGNNYLAGSLAGDFLHQAAQTQWSGQACRYLVLPATGMGSPQEARITGFLDTLGKSSPPVPPSDIHMAAPTLTIHEAFSLTKKLLGRSNHRSKHLLVAALTDPIGIGAEKAIKEAGMENRAAIVGQGGARDARLRIQRGGAFKATVAYFPENYGESVIALAVSILEGQKVPITSYTNHVVLTLANLKEYYSEGE